MKKLLLSCLIISLYCSLSIAKIPTGVSHSIAPMLKQTLPSVVNIAVSGEVPPMQNPPEELSKLPRGPHGLPKFHGLGSGVIINAKHGFIVTNAHVVKDAEAIIVTLKDGHRARAKVIGKDEQSDLAVIQINTKNLTAIKFDDSDKLNVGDFVAAIGNPFGLQQTVTSGVISGLERSHLGIEGFENFIQTDAPINPGNSGGALVNMQGKLIGINTAIISPGEIGANIGIGLAIPSNIVDNVAHQLIKYGKVKRGILGVMIQNISPELAQELNLPNTHGALVTQVNLYTPAAKSGLRIGDVIEKLNNKPIKNAFQLGTNVGLLRIGSKAHLHIYRHGKTINLTTTIIDPDEQRKLVGSKQTLLSGIRLSNFDQLIDNQRVIGVEVLYTADTSAGFSSGLRPGDVIVQADHQDISTIQELEAAVIKHADKLLLKVQRGPGKLFVVLEG